MPGPFLTLFWFTNVITIVNEVKIYQLQPKSATNGECVFSFFLFFFFFFFFPSFFLIYFVFDCLESVTQIANGERSRRSAAS